jgi:hypothetical protein
MGDRQRRILFLDVDGVLHPSSSPADRLFENLGRFERLLEQHTQLDVVLSSSWRFDPDLVLRLKAASPFLTTRLVATTGVALPGRWSRYEEIKAHVRAVALVTPWRALDDSVLEFPEGCEELIRCDPERGFDDTVKGAVEAWLGAVASPWPPPGDALMARAIALLQGERRVSISYLQRQLRLGYGAALGLRAALAQEGLVDT